MATVQVAKTSPGEEKLSSTSYPYFKSSAQYDATLRSNRTVNYVLFVRNATVPM